MDNNVFAVTHPISGVLRLRNPLIFRLILFVVVFAKLAAGPDGVTGVDGLPEAVAAPAVWPPATVVDDGT